MKPLSETRRHGSALFQSIWNTSTNTKTMPIQIQIQKFMKPQRHVSALCRLVCSSVHLKKHKHKHRNKYKYKYKYKWPVKTWLTFRGIARYSVGSSGPHLNTFTRMTKLCKFLPVPCTVCNVDTLYFEVNLMYCVLPGVLGSQHQQAAMTFDCLLGNIGGGAVWGTSNWPFDWQPGLKLSEPWFPPLVSPFKYHPLPFFYKYKYRYRCSQAFNCLNTNTNTAWFPPFIPKGQSLPPF